MLEWDEALPGKPGNFLTFDQGDAKVSWKPDGPILVVMDRGARALKKESSIHGLGIEYREAVASVKE